MTIRRAGAFAVVLLTSVLLQVTLLPMVSRGGFVPDLVVVVLVVLTLEAGPRSALWAAGLGGVLVDLLAVSVPLGSSVLVYATVVYLVGLLRTYLAERADLTTAILAGLGGGLSVAGHAGLQVLLGDQPPLAAAGVAWGALVVGAFAVLLAPPVLVVVRSVLGATDAATSEALG
jgi:rod shape-determining protein MreD